MGAGFGGLQVAKGLAGVPVAVVVVDADDFHAFQPLPHQVATAGLDADDIAAPVRGIVARLGNVDVRLGRVVGLDLRDRVHHLEDGPDLGYDTLLPAAGAVTNTFGIPGVAEHATGPKSLTDAVRLRHRVLAAVERAAVDPAAIDDGALTVVVAGPVGWLAWLALHLVMLIGFRNRANVLVNRAWNYLTWDRGARRMIGSEDPTGT